jgi:hypothetical protein
MKSQAENALKVVAYEVYTAIFRQNIIYEDGRESTGTCGC